ncbi:DnaJ domain-containing protein [Winogradskyella jejuensis]|uniref:DnaJ domain-containing protein n=1 Tax=Winogradskyella jejuensis TaxID=1089305 RepID=A0A1M5SPP2_9FLAO|nr:DnaJ domain-containing protein [Winogradskyella jejuensis]SHH40435.1 DnaJ domain-containing protein [Winogradskyella jejuensis]
MITDYYSILGVTKDANLETIKKAFRKEIALYHPENNKAPEAREKFDVLIEAFNVLSNKKKREAYDLMLEKSFSSTVPMVISQKEEETYEDWKKEAKKKSKKSWESDLTDLLLLDLFFDVGIFGMFDDFGDIIGDTIGDVFDLF